MKFLLSNWTDLGRYSNPKSFIRRTSVLSYFALSTMSQILLTFFSNLKGQVFFKVSFRTRDPNEQKSVFFWHPIIYLKNRIFTHFQSDPLNVSRLMPCFLFYLQKNSGFCSRWKIWWLPKLTCQNELNLLTMVSYYLFFFYFMWI